MTQTLGYVLAGTLGIIVYYCVILPVVVFVTEWIRSKP